MYRCSLRRIRPTWIEFEMDTFARIQVTQVYQIQLCSRMLRGVTLGYMVVLFRLDKKCDQR